jgi:hypothetical protein
MGSTLGVLVYLGFGFRVLGESVEELAEKLQGKV